MENTQCKAEFIWCRKTFESRSCLLKTRTEKRQARGSGFPTTPLLIEFSIYFWKRAPHQSAMRLSHLGHLCSTGTWRPTSSHTEMLVMSPGQGVPLKTHTPAWPGPRRRAGDPANTLPPGSRACHCPAPAPSRTSAREEARALLRDFLSRWLGSKVPFWNLQEFQASAAREEGQAAGAGGSVRPWWALLPAHCTCWNPGGPEVRETQLGLPI